MKKIIFHGSPHQNLKKVKPSDSEHPTLNGLVYGSDSAMYAACFGGLWSEKDVSIGTTHSDNTDYPLYNRVKSITLTISNSDNIDLSLPCSMYAISGDFTYHEYDKSLEMTTRGTCSVVTERKFPSWEEMLKFYGVKIKYLG